MGQTSRKKFVKKDLREIENTDLFKYSPYKKLTDEQYDIAELISYPILSYFLDKNKNINDKTFLINGEAGTGKSILGIYLLKYLQDKLNENNSKSINIGYVVPMSSFRQTMKTVAKNKVEKNGNTEKYKLKSQLRVEGGEDYIQFIKDLLFNKKIDIRQRNKDYEFILFEDIKSMQNKIYEQNKKYGLSRMVAGYAWEWKTKGDSSDIAADEDCHDIEIQGNYFRWNSRTIGWVLSDSAIGEVGSIHTIQGYDLNYAGVIIGPDLKYDKKEGKIITDRDAYKDSKGKQQTTDEELNYYIKNIYSVLLTRAIKGTYIYIVDENLREYFSERVDLFERNNK